MPAVSRSDIEKNPVQIVFLAANGLWYAHEKIWLEKTLLLIIMWVYNLLIILLIKLFNFRSQIFLLHFSHCQSQLILINSRNFVRNITCMFHMPLCMVCHVAYIHIAGICFLIVGSRENVWLFSNQLNTT